MQFDRLGPYKIGRRLGRGGMGAVFEGLNVETTEPAAIKVLNPHLAEEEGFRERFELEINTLKKLKHPNIVRMLGFGEQEGHLYYAMELVRGHSVEEELQQGRRFTWREVVQYAVKLCKALRHAHDHGVIHRDIKPANLLLNEDDSDIKLTDFGIARLFGNNRLTMDGALVGTAEYMSPEQATGERVTPQSDLYSLGGVMFAMLAGRPPFRAASLAEMLHKQRFEPAPPLSRYAQGVPVELEDLINRLLSKEPAARAPNALVLGRQLSAMEHGLSMIRQRPEEDSAAPPDDGDSQPPVNKTVSNGSPPDEGRVDPRVATRPGTSIPTPPLPATPYDPNASTMIAPSASVAAVAGENMGMGTVSRAPTGPASGSSGAALQEQVAAAAQSEVRPQSELRPQATIVQNRFTTIEEDERQQEELQRATENNSSVIQIMLLLLSLAMIGGLVWYLSRPPSAEKLLSRINTAASESHGKALLGAEDDINSFLARFPDHERAADIKRYQEEINLQRQKKRLLTRAHDDDTLSPVERDYLEAINGVSIDRQRTIDKLQALVELYGSQTDLSESTAQCVEFAREDLKELRNLTAKSMPEDLAVIDANLQRAEQLRQTSPEQARNIWQSIITLYGDKPWAAESIAKAKAALEQAK
ncbi:MAG TPA: serine/threonine-protein kinase [Pirellulales bacterium]|nr:serine/threonine-protein kinase [Pirellulales bacterium]